jgi:hypothetical protein
MAALLEETLTQDELDSIERLLRSVRRGRMKIVDDISAI